MTDEEYVRAHWERADLCENKGRAAFSISIGGHGFTRACIPEGRATDSAKRAWAAAAEFTRNQQAQIRQLDEDIEVVAQQVVMASNWIVSCGENLEVERCAKAHVEKWSRILARLESARAGLRRGMKEA